MSSYGRNWGEAPSGYYDRRRYRYGGRRWPRYWDRDSERRRRSGNRGYAEPPAPPADPEPPREDAAKVLKVKKVDMNVWANARKHRTDKYECIKDRKDEDTNEHLPAELVCRRGQPIEISIAFEREYMIQRHDVQIVFRKGQSPNEQEGTLVTLNIDENGKTDYRSHEWGATLMSGGGTHFIKVKIWIPANCIIGEWVFVVTSFCDGRDETGRPVRLEFEYELESYVNILFNPWCKEDPVYMPQEDLLNEYVLNARGCLFYGTSGQIGASAWIFGQFKNRILEVAFDLVRKGFSGKESKLMSNPTNVARVVSKMVNSPDDSGVLEGNWSGNYQGGTAPTTWSGSVEILKQYWREDRPVKYGQCWVFSGVTTTVCRALGFPCRSVTNFSSAHDVDASCTIEKHLGGMAEHGDSVWNFHVWNECWFARPDLPHGNNGWQVIDATPQERSKGIYQCGPCPVAAVKRGQCDIEFDTAFVFAETSADEIHIMHDGTKEVVVKIDKTAIGKNISTKWPDGEMSKRRLDLTLDYKFQEGSEREREAVQMAQRTTKNPSPAYNLVQQDHDIEFRLVPRDDIYIGQPLDVLLLAKNVGRRPRHISQLDVIMYAKTYDGRTVGKPFYTRKFGGVNIMPGPVSEFQIRIDEKDYWQHLVQWFNVHIEVLYRVEAAGEGTRPQVGDESIEFRFRKPDLYIQAPQRVREYSWTKLQISFRNPLSIPLTNLAISFESDGFRDKKEEKLDMTVPPHGQFNVMTSAFAYQGGYHTISVTVDSRQLPDINGDASFYIE